MNKKRSSILLTVFFLVQVTLTPLSFSAESNILNAEAKLPNPCFKQLYTILYTSLSIYEKDAIEGYAKEEIIRMYGGNLFNSQAQFDLQNIDMGKKGWTRYYPFTVGREHLIIRIFLTKERFYQPQVPVLYEASIANPAVTAQVLPGINAILDDCRIKPHRFQPYLHAVETSP